MNPMTTEQAAQEKMKLESTIQAMLMTFTDRTGLIVTDININSNMRRNLDGRLTASTINVDVVARI